MSWREWFSFHTIYTVLRNTTYCCKCNTEYALCNMDSKFLHHNKKKNNNFFSYFSDVLKSPPMLLVVTTACIVQVNAATLEPTHFTNLQGKKPPMLPYLTHIFRLHTLNMVLELFCLSIFFLKSLQLHTECLHCGLILDPMQTVCLMENSSKVLSWAGNASVCYVPNLKQVSATQY